MCWGRGQTSKILAGGMKANLFSISVPGYKHLTLAVGILVSGIFWEFLFVCFFNLSFMKTHTDTTVFSHTENGNKDGVQRSRDRNNSAPPAT